MDQIDKKLLRLLQRDASRTNAEMADEVGLSPSSCLRRIRRLWAKGALSKVVALVNPAKVGRSLKAILLVELKGHGERQMGQFLSAAKAEPTVMQAYSVAGEADVVLFLRLRDMEEFDALCDRLLRDKSNVARFQSMFVIKTAKEETAVPVDDKMEI